MPNTRWWLPLDARPTRLSIYNLAAPSLRSRARTAAARPVSPRRRDFEKGHLMRRAGGIISLKGFAVAFALATPFDLPFWLDQGRLAAQARPYTTWHSYAGGANSSQYSALDQINRKNVANLQVAWSVPITGNSIFNP